MKTLKGSKKAKRRKEYLQREIKRQELKKQTILLHEATTMEEMADAMGIKLR